VSGANTYAWSPSTALSSTTGTNVIANPLSTITYTVTGDLNGCTSTAQVTVNVNQLPGINFTPVTASGCSPVTVSFTDLSSVAPPSTITSWLWNFGDNGSGNSNTSTLQNPSHTYISSGSFTVRLTVTTNNGCTTTDSIINLVTVYPNPVASFHATPTVATLSEALIRFINTSQNYDSVQWDFGDNHTSIQISPTHTYTDTGTFSVMLITTTVHGCSDTAYGDIIVKPDFSFYVPNVFTPNHDGVNEVFAGVGVNVKQSTMYIYDRWGEIIFQSNSLETPWDGTVTGSDKIAQEGVYVYLINIVDIFDRKHQYIGSVTLLK
jgi:gliding motility-associated-like protein